MLELWVLRWVHFFVFLLDSSTPVLLRTEPENDEYCTTACVFFFCRSTSAFALPLLRV